MAAQTTDLDDVNLCDLGTWWGGSSDARDAMFGLLRARRPIARMMHQGVPGFGVPGTPYWSLTRHADVVEASRRSDLFCSGQGTSVHDVPPPFVELLDSMINMDDPRHARLRRIVSRGFTPRRLDSLKVYVEQVARELIDGVVDQGECDFVTEIAALLPLRVIHNMLGIPRSEEQFVFDRTNRMLGAADPEYAFTPQAGTSTASGPGAAIQDLADLVADIARDRMTDPRDDVITALVTADVDGEALSPSELGAFFILLVTAGNETTRNAITHGLYALTKHPEQRRVWLDDIPGVTPTAVEEIVRWATPVTHFRRTVTSDGVRLGGHEFSAGDRVVLWYSSANRDESVFDDPFKFDVLRAPNDHVGFGGPGPHFCLGAHLARREIAVMFGELLARVPDIAAVEEPSFLRSNFLHGIKHMRAKWTPVRRRADSR